MFIFFFLSFLVKSNYICILFRFLCPSDSSDVARVAEFKEARSGGLTVLSRVVCNKLKVWALRSRSQISYFFLPIEGFALDSS